MNGEHERIIGDFYSEFPYPWHVTRLSSPQDAALHAALVCQELGDFTHRRLRPDARIWVPGCGVNQALIIALQFPHAQVVGSDVSEESLRMCRAAAEQVDVTNLELRDEAIGTTRYREEFDYIVCTGVIHHHPDPGSLLRRVAAALKPTGILELMVYNAFHRREITAFQEAMRLVGKTQDLWFAQRVAASLTTDNSLTRQLADELGEPEEQFADTWLNPCERNFTVGTLRETAAAAGLELEAPCVSRLAKGLGLYDWTVPVADDKLRATFDELDDPIRWQVSHLLRLDRSPLLWFYLRRADNPVPALTEADRDTAFLETVVAPVTSTERVWILERSGGYRPSDQHQQVAAGPLAHAEVLAGVDGERTVRQICEGLGEVPRSADLRRLRTELSTPAFPYVTAAVSG